MSTITLTNQNSEETTSFNYGSCGVSRVYINGLKEGELLVSEDPFYIQNTNGVLAGIDQRFTSFKLVKDEKVINTIQLNWKNNCVETTSELLSINNIISPKPWLDGIGIPTLLVILSVSFIYLIKRLRK
jgi:hypothetical protein